MGSHPAHVIASVKQGLTAIAGQELSDIVDNETIRFFVVPDEYKPFTLVRDPKTYVVCIPQSVPQELRPSFARAQVVRGLSDPFFEHPDEYMLAELNAVPVNMQKQYLETQLTLLQKWLERLIQTQIIPNATEHEALLSYTNEFYRREISAVTTLLQRFR